MEKKKFNCKVEEVPVIAGFIVDSLAADLTLFANFSPVFNASYLQQIRDKRSYCQELERSGVMVQRLKSVTEQLVGTERGLSPLLNKLEGYVKLAATELDVPAASFGMLALRGAISRGNDEGILSGIHTLLQNIDRNRPALQAKGLKAEITDYLTDAAAQIDQLNNEQNSLMNERNLTTASNTKDYNELWDLITPVCDAARSLYRGVDEAKLKQYTLTTLLKRMNAEGTQTEPVAPATATK